MTARHLFIAGCPRSGTTALADLLNADLLNADERIIVGMERYKFIRESITPRHFERDAFFNVKPTETNLAKPRLYDALKQKWNRGEINYIGDKVPGYFYQIEYLAETFPQSRLVFLLRDIYRVASSYNRRSQEGEDSWPVSKNYHEAVIQWNESLEKLQRLLLDKHRDRIFLVEYDRFFGGEPSYLKRLYEFLELPLNDGVQQKYNANINRYEKIQEKELFLGESMKAHIDRHCNRELERWCIEKCRP